MVRVVKVSERLYHQFFCDSCGQLPAGPNVQAADLRARRHAAQHPDHMVSATHVVQINYLTRTVN